MATQAAIGAELTLPGMFFDVAKKRGRKTLYAEKIDGRWKTYSWREIAKQVTGLGYGLRMMGVETGDRVVLCSENSPRWCMSDIAIMAAGGIAVPAYTTNTTTDHSHIITDSGAKGVIVSTRALAKRILPAAMEAPSCKFVLCMEPLLIRQQSETEIHAFDAVIAEGLEKKDDLAEIYGGIDTNETSCLIYTSGTGGTPKGVMLSHRAILSNCRAVRDVLADWGKGDDTFLSFLPLSHSYEHMAGMWAPISLGAEVYFAESVDKLTENMGEVRPTVMTAVPRLFEAIRARILKGLNSAPKRNQQLFNIAVNLGRKKYDGKELTTKEKVLDKLVERLVRRKISKRFGGRLKAFVSGGAALNYEVGTFFEALGLTIIQGYGQTECAPVATVNRRGLNKIDSVGKPVGECEVVIAPDGEIIMRGKNIMNGYWRNPEATAKTVIDGWLHTGDIGEFDGDGYLRITDRKKDIIVNSGGDNISPARVEGFLTLEAAIGQAMVYGDKRPNLVAVLIPDLQWLAEFAAEKGLSGSNEELIVNDVVVKEISDAVSRVNQGLSNIEKVRRFTLSAEEFSTENGLMTPSLKVRRHLVTELFQDQLEALYPKKAA